MISVPRRPFIYQNSNTLFSQCFPGLLSSLEQCLEVILISGFIVDKELVLTIHGRLGIITYLYDVPVQDQGPALRISNGPPLRLKPAYRHLLLLPLPALHILAYVPQAAPGL